LRKQKMIAEDFVAGPRRIPESHPTERDKSKDFDGVCFCFICAQSGLCGTSSIWCKEVKNTF
jgi:hypothetical protein